MKQPKKSVEKRITFHPGLYSIIEEKATQLGVSFPEYIRSLAVESIQEDTVPCLEVSAELDDQITIAVTEVKQGKGVELDPENPAHIKAMFEAS